MSAIDSHPAAQSAAGVLKPWALLWRLRPVKVAAVRRHLLDHHHLNSGFSLIRQHFPDELEVYRDVSQVGWWQVLAHLANLVEQAEWFEINWPALNEAWAYWMESEEEHGEHLAVFLQYIPVTLYGFTDNERIFECPPMELLHALLCSRCEMAAVSAQLLIDAEIYDALDEVWGEPEREAAWARLHQIECDPGHYPEPVRWLPELARWAGHQTGNVMLDRHFDPFQDGPWFTWADDLEEVKHAWQRAGPVVRALERLSEWCETDSTNIARLANFIMLGGNDDELTW